MQQAKQLFMKVEMVFVVFPLGHCAFLHPLGKLMKCCSTYHHVTDVLEAAYHLKAKYLVDGKSRKMGSRPKKGHLK